MNKVIANQKRVKITIRMELNQRGTAGFRAGGSGIPPGCGREGAASGGIIASRSGGTSFNPRLPLFEPSGFTNFFGKCRLITWDRAFLGWLREGSSVSESVSASGKKGGGG